MESKIKVLFFDFDFTLFDHKTKEVPFNVVTTLKDLQAKGIKIVMNTARSYFSLSGLKTYQLMSFDANITLCGNTTFIGDKLILDKPIDKSKVEKIMKICRDNDISYIFATQYREYIYLINNDQKVIDFCGCFYDPFPILEEFYDQSPIYQIKVFIDESKEYLFDEFKGDLFTHRFFKDLIEFKQYAVTKGESIESVLKYFGVKKEECAAFGDADNDIKMFEAVGVGIAMGNAYDNVKKAADFVTTNIEDDGILNGLRYLKLID